VLKGLRGLLILLDRNTKIVKHLLVLCIDRFVQTESLRLPVRVSPFLGERIERREAFHRIERPGGRHRHARDLTYTRRNTDESGKEDLRNEYQRNKTRCHFRRPNKRGNQ